MKLTKEQVEKIAQLARLKLTDEELERYAGQLTDILTYVEVIKELDTTGVPETSQVTGLMNVTRKDEARGGGKLVPSGASSSYVQGPLPDELLECSPLEKVDHQIRIKRIM
ncbi:MAG: Asp-tRNA(Asn)/Glu-tRNA(Gln) amidotransferase subunit GatC [Candidatus Gracilibacteria bacterium]